VGREACHVQSFPVNGWRSSLRIVRANPGYSHTVRYLWPSLLPRSLRQRTPIIATSPPAHHPPLLASRLRLVGLRGADVARLPGSAHERDAEVLEAIANDLVGARFVIRAAPAAPSPRGASGAEREDLERGERKATELLQR
jgi:hypothetical protein